MIQVSGLFHIVLSRQKLFGAKGGINIYDAVHYEGDRKTYVTLKDFFDLDASQQPKPVYPNRSWIQVDSGSLRKDGYMKDGQWLDQGFAIYIVSAYDVNKYLDEEFGER